MPIVIDCYNLLHTPMPPGLAGLDEAGLCRLLGRGPWGPAVVVCDGVVKPSGLAESGVGGVRLVYSGKGRSADDVIVDLIAKDTAPRRLIVVSSDREIQKAARRRRAQAVSSEAFVSELSRLAPASKRAARGDDKPGDDLKLSAEQVEQWVRRFDVKEDTSPESIRIKQPPRVQSAPPQPMPSAQPATPRPADPSQSWQAGVTPLRNRKRRRR